MYQIQMYVQIFVIRNNYIIETLSKLINYNYHSPQNFLFYNFVKILCVCVCVCLCVHACVCVCERARV